MGLVLGLIFDYFLIASGFGFLNFFKKWKNYLQFQFSSKFSRKNNFSSGFSKENSKNWRVSWRISKESMASGSVLWLIHRFFGNLINFPMAEKYSKLNISWTLGLKGSNSSSWNFTQRRFFNNIKSTLKFSCNFRFSLNEFSVKKLFNSS